jgi:DNA repair protein RadC
MPTDELLATVCGTGRAGELLARYGVSELAGRSIAELVSDGMPAPAARRLASAFEVARRAARRTTPREAVTSTEAVYRAFSTRFSEPVEEFWACLTDAKGRLLREVMVSRGTLTNSLVHPREVFRVAIRAAAVGVILVHNHPSGDPEPSDDDRDLTRRLEAVGELVGIRVLDHIVIGSHGYVSFLERGWICGR